MNARESLSAVLTARKISNAAVRALVATVKPATSLALTREENEAAIPIGATKVGGSPDMARGFAWPMSSGVHWRFLAQINLCDVREVLPDSPLPETGLLSFFWSDYVPALQDAEAKVVYSHPEGSLVRVPDPWAKVPERVGLVRRALGRKPSTRGHGYWPCSVELEYTMTWPDQFGPRGLPKGTLADDEFDDVFGGGMEKELQSAGLLLEGHRLLGEAGPVQGAVEYDAESDSRTTPANDPAASARAASEWRLLLQLNSDDAPGFCFGDWGAVYFMIRERDMTANRWDKVRVVSQCH